MQVRNSRVIVTGGAGFIGSHLVDALLRQGNDVIVIDDLSSGTRENLVHHRNNSCLHVEEANVLDEQGIMALHKGADFVFHLATRNLRLSLRQPTIVHEVNTTGTLNVLKAAAAAKVKRFLYCSSSEVNGTADVVPMPEDYYFRPQTIYGASKLAGEYYTQVFHRARWLFTVIARPHNNYGPRAHYQGFKGEVIPRFILWALAGRPLIIYGNGRQTRDFTYVTETADIMVGLMECDSAVGGTFNICRGQEVSIREIAKLVSELTGLNSPPDYFPERPSDVLRLIGDPTHLRNALGRSPNICIREGLAKTVAWFREHIPINESLLASLQPNNWSDVPREPWLPEVADLVKLPKMSEVRRSPNRGDTRATKEIPIVLLTLEEEEARAARQTILTGWVTQGPKVRAFEEVFAAYAGAHYACAVSSCTAALHLALLAVGVRPGDVVVTVSHSFIATANAIRHCQAEPVFVDIDPDTLNMDPRRLARCLTDDFQEENGALWYRYADRLAMGESPLTVCARPIGRLAAILVVHQVGMPADLHRILPLSRQYGIPVVEDAACAIGSEISLDDGASWEKIGRPNGDIACFSFHPRKLITTGEGGMLTTNNPEYDHKFRLLRHHGMDLSDYARHYSEKVAFEKYVITGYNYRMTDIQAAVGIEQLKRLPEIVEQRRVRASIYQKRLTGIQGVKAFVEPKYAKTNWQSYVVRLDDRFSQKEVMQTLKDMGINTRRGIMCSHLEPPYSKAWPEGCLPNSEKAQQHCIVLPLYTAMSEDELEQVVNELSKLVNVRGT